MGLTRSYKTEGFLHLFRKWRYEAMCKVQELFLVNYLLRLCENDVLVFRFVQFLYVLVAQWRV